MANGATFEALIGRGIDLRNIVIEDAGAIVGVYTRLGG